MKILLTAFDAFGGEKINPALEAIRILPEKLDKTEIIKLEIPTIYKKAPQKIIEKIEEVNPDVVLSVGQAGGYSSIKVEFIGINYADARIPDNEGKQAKGEKIFEDGQNAYFSNLPVKAIVENLRENNIPANLSYSAGTFVCNDVLYSIQYYINKFNRNIKSGFIHVPYTPEQVVSKSDGTPSMSLNIISKAIEIAIKTIASMDEDIEISMGKTE
ncbi:MAG: pyroglutamyl-peptidase I [Peptoniphilaceae bacterium]